MQKAGEWQSHEKKKEKGESNWLRKCPNVASCGRKSVAGWETTERKVDRDVPNGRTTYLDETCENNNRGEKSLFVWVLFCKAEQERDIWGSKSLLHREKKKFKK